MLNAEWLEAMSLSEKEAVTKSLLLCGFKDMVSSFVHEFYSYVYIPARQAETFDLAIEYMDYYTFNRIPTKEERLVFYRTAQRLRRFKSDYVNQS